MKLSILLPLAFLLCATPPAPALPLNASPLLRSALCSQRRKKKVEEEKPERLSYWIGDLKAAHINARERGVATLILCVLHDEEASERFSDQLADNAELALKTQAVVVVLVNNGRHEMKMKTFYEKGEKVEREVCSVFHTRSCNVHQRNWDAVYQQYVLAFDPDGDWELPEAIVVSPDGKIFDRIGGSDPPEDDEIKAAIKKVQAKFGMGIGLDVLRLVKAAKDAAQKESRREEWAASWVSWEKVRTLAERGPFAEEAAQKQPLALEKMKQQLSEAVAMLKPGEVRAGFSRLLLLREGFSGTPLEKELATAVKRAEKDKRFKVVINQIKTEAKAQEIWAEASSLLKAGKRKKAARLAKKLMTPKYKDTPASREALKNLPELAGGGK